MTRLQQLQAFYDAIGQQVKDLRDLQDEIDLAMSAIATAGGGE